MKARTFGYWMLAFNVAVFFGWMPLPPLTSLIITGALLLLYWHRVDREVDAILREEARRAYNGHVDSPDTRSQP